MRIALAAVTAALIIAITACGGSGAPPTTAKVAAQIGATGLHPYDKGPFARDAVSARWHGRGVVIATFDNGTAEQAYVRTVEGFGEKPLLQGSGYVVFPN